MKDKEKDFVPYIHSNMMKELGFVHDPDDITQVLKNKEHNKTYMGILFQRAGEWLWAEHEIFIEIVDVSTTIDGDTTDEFQVTIKQGEENIEYFDHVSSPIIAHREGILKAIEHLYKQK